MNRLYLGLVLASLFVPVAWRTTTWQRAVPTPLDPAEVEAGKTLFSHKWTANDPFCEGGDGIGPVFNAESCVACHFKGGVGGSGGLTENVTTYRAFGQFGNGSPITGILHAMSTTPDRNRWSADEFLETMDKLEAGLERTSRPTLEQIKNLNARGSVIFSQRNTPALFGADLIDAIPDREIIAQARWQQLSMGMANSFSEMAPVGRTILSKDGRVGKFGWKAQTPTLLDFVQGACANELGLSNPTQPQPMSISQPNYTPKRGGTDLTLKQCQQMAAFIASLPHAERVIPKDEPTAESAHRGEALFHSMGCAACHVQNLGPAQGIYSDLLVHRMGRDLEAQGHYYAPPSDGDSTTTPLADEWRTPPLWGIADSAPYLHDGRAATLGEAIRLHGGQAASSARNFRLASPEQRDQLITFLKTLRAPGQN